MRNMVVSLIVLLSSIVLLAELPQGLDDYLFKQTVGTNYVQWMTTEGEMNFVRPFMIFDKAEFRLSHPTNDLLPLHYSILMQKKIPDGNIPTLLRMFKDMEVRLSKEFHSARFTVETKDSVYCSVCKNIDGLGWDVTMSVAKGNSDLLWARIFFYNSLHKAGRFVSCEDFEVVDRMSVPCE